MKTLSIAVLFALAACNGPSGYVASRDWHPQVSDGLQVSSADEAQCDYEAQAATVNSRGLLTPIGDYNRIFGACLRARAAASR